MSSPKDVTQSWGDPNRFICLPICLLGALSPVEMVVLGDLLTQQRAEDRAIGKDVDWIRYASRSVEIRLDLKLRTQSRTLSSLAKQGLIKVDRSAEECIRLVKLNHGKIQKLIEIRSKKKDEIRKVFGEGGRRRSSSAQKKKSKKKIRRRLEMVPLREDEKEWYHEVVVQFYHALRDKRRLMRLPNLRGWAKTIKEFEAINPSHIDSEEIRSVMSWFCDHMGEEFVPNARSAISFCEKFISIRDAMNRDIKKRGSDVGKHNESLLKGMKDE